VQTVRQKAQAGLSGKMEGQAFTRETGCGAGQAEEGHLMTLKVSGVPEAR